MNINVPDEIASVVSVLTDKANNALQLELDGISESNRFYSGNIRASNVFLYQGMPYNLPKGVKFTKRALADLDPLDGLLHSEMQTYLHNYEKLLNDRKQMFQVLCAICSRCTTAQELRDTLPDFLIRFSKLTYIPKFIHDQFYLIPDMRPAIKAYESTLPMLCTYAAMDLLT